jgi:hypothetical protein
VPAAMFTSRRDNLSGIRAPHAPDSRLFARIDNLHSDGKRGGHADGTNDSPEGGANPSTMSDDERRIEPVRRNMAVRECRSRGALPRSAPKH